MSATCERWHETMTAHLFGEAPEGDVGQLNRHLAECPACQMHWAELTEDFDRMSAHPRPQGRAGVAQRLLERLTPELRPAPAAAPEDRKRLAEIAMIEGDVHRRRGREEDWQPVETGASLSRGDTLRVGRQARALVRLADRSELWVNAGTLLRLALTAKGCVVRLMRGEMLAFMEKQRRPLRVLTADGEVGVVGTVFHTATAPGVGTRVSVLRGCVRVSTGGQSRDITRHRRVSMRGWQTMGRTRRVSMGQMRQLEGWIAPLRAASRASEGTTLQTVRRQAAMSSALRLLAAAAVIGLVVVGYAMRRSAGDQTGVEQATAALQSRVVEARRISLAEPVRLVHVPSPGDRWTQTTHLSGSTLVQRPTSADERSELNMRLVTEASVAADAQTGATTIEHRVVDVSVDLEQTAGNANTYELLPRDSEQLAAMLRRATITETLGPDGERREVVVDGVGPRDIEARSLLPLLISSVSGIPAEPQAPGSSWTRREDGNLGLLGPIVSTGSFAHAEEMDGRQLAVVRSEVRSQLEEPVDLGRQFGLGPRGLMGAQATLTELDLSWSGESRHRVADGRRVMTTGHLDERLVVAVSQVGGDDRPYRGTFRAHLDFDFAIEIEHDL